MDKRLGPPKAKDDSLLALPPKVANRPRGSHRGSTSRDIALNRKKKLPLLPGVYVSDHQIYSMRIASVHVTSFCSLSHFGPLQVTGHHVGNKFWMAAACMRAWYQYRIGSRPETKRRQRVMEVRMSMCFSVGFLL